MEGVKNGIGEERNKKGLIEYRGYFAYGKRNGYGALFWPNDRPKYIGQFKLGSFHGEGEEFDMYGTRTFIGTYMEDERMEYAKEF